MDVNNIHIGEKPGCVYIAHDYKYDVMSTSIIGLIQDLALMIKLSEKIPNR